MNILLLLLLLLPSSSPIDESERLKERGHADFMLGYHPTADCRPTMMLLLCPSTSTIDGPKFDGPWPWPIYLGSTTTSTRHRSPAAASLYPSLASQFTILLPISPPNLCD
jgi:hypothetical protein